MNFTVAATIAFAMIVALAIGYMVAVVTAVRWITRMHDDHYEIFLRDIEQARRTRRRRDGIPGDGVETVRQLRAYERRHGPWK